MPPPPSPRPTLHLPSAGCSSLDSSWPRQLIICISARCSALVTNVSRGLEILQTKQMYEGMSKHSFTYAALSKVDDGKAVEKVKDLAKCKAEFFQSF